MWSKGRAILALVAVLLPSVTRAQPEVTATGAIIVDANTGAVFWEQDADLPLPPASTTKVLTAIVALQSGRLDQRLLVTGNASSVEPTKIGLRPGQEVELHDLLYAVLLRSANDAAVVVAEGLGGSIEAFAQRMNEKAHSLGATRSNFVNPHGLTEPGHYTTARDLATIFRYGLRVPLFRDILSTPTAEVAIDGPDGRVTMVRSHNRLLNAPEFQVIGKTGFTRAARRCFVGAAGDGSHEVVIALLGSRDLWGDARRMLYYGLTEGARPAVQMASAPGYPAAVVLVPRTTSQPPPAEEPPPQPQRVAYVPPPPPPQPVAYVPPPPPSPPPAALAVVARAEPTATVPPPPRAEEPKRIAAGPPPDNDDDDDRPAARSRAADSGRPSQEIYDQEIGDGANPQNQAAIDYARRRARSMWAAPPDVAPTQPGEAPPMPTPAATAPAPAAAEPRPAHAEAAPADEPVRAAAPVRPSKAGARATDDDDDTVEDSPRRKSPAPQQVGSRRTTVASAPAATQKRRASARAARDEDEGDDTPARATAQKSRKGQAVAKADSSRRSRLAKDDDEDDEDTAPRSRRGKAADDDRRHPTSQVANAKDRNGRTVSTKDGRDASVTRVAASDARRTSGRHGRGAADSDGDPKLPPPGRFTVQLGPYRNRKAVETAREDLSRRGYEAKVVGQSLQLGNFTQKGLADRLAGRLRVSGHPATSATLR